MIQSQHPSAPPPRRVPTITAADLDDARRSTHDDDTIHECGLCMSLPVEESNFIGGGFQ